MKEKISWFNEIPAKVFFVLSLAGIFYFYGGDYVLFKMHPDVEKYAYPLFVFSIIITACNGLVLLWKGAKYLFSSLTENRKYRKIISNLDNFERIIICEFYVQNRTTLSMKWDDPVVQGLVDRNILLHASNIINGFDMTFKINPVLKSVIDPERDLDITAYKEFRKNNMPEHLQSNF